MLTKYSVSAKGLKSFSQHKHVSWISQAHRECMTLCFSLNFSLHVVNVLEFVIRFSFEISNSTFSL